MTTNFQYIKAVIFDLDGVLVETIALKAKSHEATVHSFGGYADHNLYADVVGLSHQETRSAFIRASKIEIDPEAYTQTYRLKLSEFITNKLELTPGVFRLIQKVSESGVPMAVVTSSPANFLNRILEQTGIASFFALRISADDVINEKPSPDPYLLAMEKMSISPRKVIIFEDTKAGLDAALSAGANAMVFRHQYNRNQDFSGAVQVFDPPIDPESVYKIVSNFHI